MQFPDREIYSEGTCRCGRTETLITMSELGGPLCETCYPESIQRRVEKSIRRYRMIPKASRVAVAVSGGKDSGSLLHVLQALARGRLNFSMLAVYVNMGIEGYSDESEAVCRRLCGQVGVEFVSVSIDEWGVRVQPTGRWPVCAVCGGIRRPILALVAKRLGCDVLCTGHTLDDQLVYALKNLLSGKSEPPRPVTPPGPVFSRKVKPLFWLPDRAMAEYARLESIPVMQQGCPRFLPHTHRFKDVFEALESVAPLAKKQFLGALAKNLKIPDHSERVMRDCPVCGEATYFDPCPLCRVRELQEKARDEAFSCMARGQNRPAGQ